MSTKASIELRDLKLQTQIGTYKTGDIIPDNHVLDLTLWIDSNLVFISEDNMSNVFDYDPLVLEITRLASDCHYETQERLMSRITEACASYPQIQSLEIGLRKSPVRNNSGSLGLRLNLDQAALSKLRS
ncbi:dihydroneopterin aldolase [Polynucleobacter sp. MG-28-Ekke-A2]|uniref:dihydroneopterin aldolase n=1 Tax=Polynucleobacter sp. MG-28-Ekke-A2 TaxID=3108276 RepID=UPI002B230AE3|nr:dihydroneopterin aldolase [Polynucleobacter sp. MG-28-Ekke-A2]MEA9602269.1 dihydroneopterin aldolase [Polynucleobacter sp. MG-28-Ekke-A2]